MSRNNAVILAAATFFMLIVSIVTICRVVSFANQPSLNEDEMMSHFNTPQGISNRTVMNQLKKSDKQADQRLAYYLEHQEKAKQLANIQAFTLAANFFLAIFYILAITQNEAINGVRKAFWSVAILIGNIFIMSLYAVIFLGPVILDNVHGKEEQSKREKAA